jgi:hypothetical protein
LDQKIGHQVELMIEQQPQIFLAANGIHRHGCSGRV